MRTMIYAGKLVPNRAGNHRMTQDEKQRLLCGHVCSCNLLLTEGAARDAAPSPAPEASR